MDEYKRRRRRSRAVMSMFLDSLGGSIDNVDVAEFDSDGSDLKALIVGIDPVQDLHGYDAPWPSGGGVNKWDEEWEIGGWNIDGTPSLVTDRIRCKNPVPVTESTQYYFCASGTYWYYVFFDATMTPLQASLTQALTNSVVTSPANAAFMLFYMSAAYGTTYKHDIAINYPSSVITYSPYSNICPISGHSSVNVIVSPTLNPLDGIITNIPLGTTVYGGQLDVLTGVLMDADAEIASYNGETINEPWMSSMDAYSPGATPTTGAQVVYPLATPQTIQLTGQQISTFLGTNHVWCDSGKIIHLEY